MANRLDDILSEIAALQAEFERELEEGQKSLSYTLKSGRARFDTETRAAHKAAREGLASLLRNIRPLHLLTAPVIYSLILPFALLDLFVTLYQALCFPVYRLEKVRRADHILIDRQHLGYLNLLEKLNCLYCSYCNGLISYVREIAARTEAYWCPIKHSRRMKGAHDHHAAFTDYGDAEAWRTRMAALRAGQGIATFRKPPKA
jgi:hypothetical protein